MVLMDFSTLDLHGALAVDLMMGLALQMGNKSVVIQNTLRKHAFNSYLQF